MICRCCRSTNLHIFRAQAEPLVPGATWHRCGDCGSLTLDQPYPKTAYDATYLTHLERAVGREALERELNDNIAVLRDLPGAWALDVGCLEGTMIDRLFEIGYVAWGFDVIPGGPRRMDSVVVVADSLETADFGGRRFDLITCREVIEHVDDPLSLLARMHELLFPGGWLHIQTPQFSRTTLTWDVDRHLAIFTPCELRRQLERLGFAVDVDRSKEWEGGMFFTARR